MYSYTIKAKPSLNVISMPKHVSRGAILSSHEICSSPTINKELICFIWRPTEKPDSISRGPDIADRRMCWRGWSLFFSWVTAIPYLGRESLSACYLSGRRFVFLTSQHCCEKKRQLIDYCKHSVLYCQRAWEAETQPPLRSAATVAMPTLYEVSCRGGQKRMLAPLVVRTVNECTHDLCTQGPLHDYKKKDNWKKMATHLPSLRENS